MSQKNRERFVAELVRVNRELECPPGRNASKDAPQQYTLTRKFRRRIAKARARRSAT